MRIHRLSEEESKMKRTKVVLDVTILLFLIVSCSSAARAQQIITLTFDELPFQPVDGLSFMGVTFGFTINGQPSQDANYHSFGPGRIRYVQDPSLEGNAAGTLTLDFDTPTQLLEFGLAINNFGGAFARGFSVELFDDLGSLGIFNVATAPVVIFSESRFNYEHGRPVSRAVITFNTDVAQRFALDNLTFFTPSVVPSTRAQPNFEPGGTPWRH